jgi:hypothetical protein
VVVAARLEEGRRRLVMSSEVPGAREPLDAVAQHDATLELSKTHGEEQRHSCTAPKGRTTLQ